MKNSEKLLDKIQNENIQQRNRFKFTARNILFWTLFSIGIITGGIAFSVIIYTAIQTDFDILDHIQHSRIEFLLGLLPIFWIVFAIIFLIISLSGIKATKRGYKYNPLLVFAGTIACSFVLGIIFYFSGGAQKIESIFAKNFPGYQSVNDKKLATWLNPNDGFLSGTIVWAEESVIQLKDWEGKDWRVDLEDALIRGRAVIKEGEQIKLIGTLTGASDFSASEIRPWNGAGRHSQHE